MPLDFSNPKVRSLCIELQALQALPLVTAEDLATWELKAQSLQSRLHTDYEEISANLPHELWHYLIDSDIRARDRAYGEYQCNILSDFLKTKATQ